MVSTLNRRHLLLGAAALPLLTSNTALVGSTMAQSQHIHVSDYAQLASAINSARAGDEIILRDGGSFDGNRLTVSARGTATQPIVIRAANLLGANVPNGFLLTGEYITVSGIGFSHGGTSSFVDIAGKGNGVERCRFRAHGRHIRLLTGSAGRVMYCEFSCPDKSDAAPSTVIVQTAYKSIARHVGAEIGYCYFHNMPFKQRSYSARVRVAIGLGLNGTYSQFHAKHYVHHCLFEGTGDCELSVKTRSNRIEYCTMIGDNAQFNQRFGGNNVYKGCWAEENRGFEIFSSGNTLVGCKAFTKGRRGIYVFAGNQSPTSTGHLYPQAVDTVLEGCDGWTLIGTRWTTSPSMSLPALRTSLAGHSGRVDYGTHSQTRTLFSASSSSVKPIKLSRSQVGPFA